MIERYGDLIAELKERIQPARMRAALAVNSELVLLYWDIGRGSLARLAEAAWGAKVVRRLAADLQAEFLDMRGLSAHNLLYMRYFAESWPDRELVQQVVARIPWGHIVRLLDRVAGKQERLWYAQMAAQHGWSRQALVAQIEARLFQRLTGALPDELRGRLPTVAESEAERSGEASGDLGVPEACDEVESRARSQP